MVGVITRKGVMDNEKLYQVTVLCGQLGTLLSDLSNEEISSQDFQKSYKEIVEAMQKLV
jgi:hypothetical protein